MTDTTRQDLDERRSGLLREVADRLQSSTDILNGEGHHPEYETDWDMCLIRAVSALLAHNRALEEEIRAMWDDKKALAEAISSAWSNYNDRIANLEIAVEKLNQQTAGSMTFR